MTFVGGGTQNISFETTAAGGNSAEFFGIVSQNMPLITNVRLDASGDGRWGIDNIMYAVPEGPPFPICLNLFGLYFHLRCTVRQSS